MTWNIFIWKIIVKSYRKSKKSKFSISFFRFFFDLKNRKFRNFEEKSVFSTNFKLHVMLTFLIFNIFEAVSSTLVSTKMRLFSDLSKSLAARAKWLSPPSCSLGLPGRVEFRDFSLKYRILVSWEILLHSEGQDLAIRWVSRLVLESVESSAVHHQPDPLG